MNEIDYNPRRQKGLLDQFLARSALLVGIYLIINTIYQQSYLAYLGFHIGLWPIASSLPLLNDIIITSFVFLIWIILTRIPDGWFHHVVEIANPSTWGERKVAISRMLGLLSVFLFYFLLNILYIYTLPFPFLFPYGFYQPTTEFFSWNWTLIASSIMLVLVSYFSIRSYVRLRRFGLDQLQPENLRRMQMLINVQLPAIAILGFITLMLIFPSWYGKSRAYFDINRMINYQYQEVQSLELKTPVCSLQYTFNGNTYISLSESWGMKIYYVGQLLGDHLFLLMESKQGFTKELSFLPCLIGDDDIISISLPEIRSPIIPSVH